MTSRVLAIFGMLAAALVTLGCAPDCNAICEEGNACPGAVKVECAKSCSTAESLNPKGLCEDQFTDYLDCLDNRDDLCKTGATVCAKRLGDYRDCVAGYCLSMMKDTNGDGIAEQTDKDCQTLGL